MHDLLGESVDHNGLTVAPFTLMVGLEVRIPFAAETGHSLAVELLEERDGELQPTGGQAFVDEIQRGDVADELDLRTGVGLEILTRGALGFNEGQVVPSIIVE